MFGTFLAGLNFSNFVHGFSGFMFDYSIGVCSVLVWFAIREISKFAMGEFMLARELAHTAD